MAELHSYEIAAQKVAEWVGTRSEELANALRENNRAPFAAPLNEPQKLAYYEKLLYHHDGTENALGHEKLLKTLGSNDLGLRNYALIKAAVLQARAARVAPRPLPTPGEADDGVA